MRIATFRSDITPPVGHPLCAGWYPTATGVDQPLFANGLVLLPKREAPIVLCALDWAELSNGEYELWKHRLAEAAGTSPDRVSIHCIHAHDAPWPDRDAQRILDAEGHPGIIMQYAWCDEALQSAAAAIKGAQQAQPVTEIRSGQARISRLASNRRILGPDGRSRGVRWTQCRDASLRAEPEGLIDPDLKTISFWRGNDKLAALHYYAVHPTSYDRTGLATPDFVGLARERLAREEGVPHLYFTECAGNITPGKYNDGVADNRELFTSRIYDAMVGSERSATSHEPEEAFWKTRAVILPPREDEERLLAFIRDPLTTPAVKSRAALALAYRRRCEAGLPILISALRLGGGILSVQLPGEAFIEYQMFVRQLCPDRLTVVPSYGDCGPGYITLERSFAEGGYEPTDSFCSGASEAILKNAIREVVTG